MARIPHLTQYQGSKRNLANRILAFMPARSGRLIEPFAGLAAISLASAWLGKAEYFLINDLNGPLLGMLREAIENPESLVHEYGDLWREQFSFEAGHIAHFYHIREIFNAGCRKPALMLYLLARCVKGSPRYGRNGNFNQSPDKRRHGTNPQKMRDNIFAVSALLKGKTSYANADYREILDMARPGDIIYMDPPYQGVCSARDKRYFAGISHAEFILALERLNKRNMDFLISYDGKCGEKSYGAELPESLECEKILLEAGRSSQQTLLGRHSTTYEALYVSRGLRQAPDFSTFALISTQEWDAAKATA